MIRMQTPSTNIGTGSIKTAFIRDKAVTGDKINVTGALDHQVLTYDLASDTVVWDDVSNLDNTFENGIVVSGAQSQFNAELQVNANIDLNGDIAISGAITDLTSITADTTFSFDVTTGNLEFDVAGYIHADTTNLYVGSLSQAVNITGTTIGAIGSTIDITGNLTGDVTGTVSTLSNHDTGDLSEGSNLYYTDARVQNWFGTVGLSMLSTDVVTEGSSNLYYTDARVNTWFETSGLPALQATQLDLAEGLTVDTDITIGDSVFREQSYYPTTGLRIVSPDDKAAWAGIQLIEYGGDYADGDSTPFNIHLPILSGEIHAGTVASPTAVSAFENTLTLVGAARYGTGASDVGTVGFISIVTNENQTATNRGAKISFNVNPTGETAQKEVLILNADNNSANFAFDPNGDFADTEISTQSTNGFKWDNANRFTGSVQMDQNLDVTGNLGVTGDITLATGDISVFAGTMQGATVNAYTLNAGNLTISGDSITTSGAEVEFDADFNVTGTTYFGTGSGTGISSGGEIGTFGSATKVPFGAPIQLDRIASDPTGETGMMYFNTATSKFRGYNGTAWVDLG